MNLIWITSAKYLNGYCLQLTFNNGEVKIFDGKEIVDNNPFFFPLQAIAVFKDFLLDGWKVSWQNGKLDLFYRNQNFPPTNYLCIQKL